MDLSRIYPDNRLKEVREFQEKQINLEGCRIGEHKFGGFFSALGGIAHECRICGFGECGKIIGNKLVINPPLDRYGFLDRAKYD